MDVLYYLDTEFQHGAYSVQCNCSAPCLARTPKKFLASRFTSGLCGPLNMRSSITPIMPLAQPAYENAQRHRGDAIQKKKTFLGFGKVLQILNLCGLKIYNTKSNNVAIPRVATGKNWKQGWAAALYPFIHIHGCEAGKVTEHWPLQNNRIIWHFYFTLQHFISIFLYFSTLLIC